MDAQQIIEGLNSYVPGALADELRQSVSRPRIEFTEDEEESTIQIAADAAIRTIPQVFLPEKIEELLAPGGTGRDQGRDEGEAETRGGELEARLSDDPVFSQSVGVARERIRKRGIDALAWYAPYHFYGEHLWGIYIPESSLWILAELCFSADKFSRRQNKPSIFERLVWSYHKLLEHERFHFITEVMSSQAELALEQPLYRPNRKRRDPNYSYERQEEMMANAFAIRRLGCIHVRNRKVPKAVVKAVKEYCRHQPPGYKDGPSAISDGAFERGLEDLAKIKIGLDAAASRSQFRGTLLDLPALFPGANAEKSFSFRDQRLMNSCPLHVIQDAENLGVPPDVCRLIRAITNIEESPRASRRLEKDCKLRDAWEQTKDSLAASGVPRYPAFEKMRGKHEGLFSIRVIGMDTAIRAHLKLGRRGKPWLLVDIGNHKKMGHG